MCSYMLVLAVCPFGLKQIVSTNKMINISKSVETSHFINRTRTYSQSSNFARIIDCEQSLFGQSSLSSAGLERANWPRGELERGGKKRDCILFCNRRVQISPRPQHRRTGLVDKQ